jgi:hypothetical protein
MPTLLRRIDPNTLNYQVISPEDTSLLGSLEVTSLFDPTRGQVEYYIYDIDKNLIYGNENYNLWTVTEDPSLAETTLQTNLTGSNLDYIPSPQTAKISTLNIDPIKDAELSGFNFGKIQTIYNFLTYELNSSPINQFFISNISSDRTEIRLKTNFISDESLTIGYEFFKDKIINDPTFDEFYLNFGGNQLVLAVNILLDNTQSPNSILIKLYEPLPQDINTKNECYIVTKNGESVAYEISFEENIIFVDPTIPIQGPNFNLDLLDKINPSTNYQSYKDITSTPLSGSYYQLLTNLTSSGIYINVDYSDYSNFVQFSSAAQRLDNFRQKLITISSSQAEINIIYSEITGSTSESFAVSSSKTILENTIQNTITSFDDYEYYLYYESSSTSWPKSNNIIPYVLYDVNSVTGNNWYNSQSTVAQTYDAYNQNYIYYSIPDYIVNDSQNDNYILFSELVSQLFDNIWVYEKSITDKLDSNPNLNIGVSPALVADTIQSLGIKLYGSNFTTQNIYNSLLGYSPSGSVLLPTGSKYVTTYITASVSQSVVPTIDDYHKLTYKKIYHSLPYLLKRKGTVQGLRSLINIFGVAPTLLRINEFGGKDKNVNTWDNWQDEFNYSFYTSGSAYITSSFVLNSTWSATNNRPAAVEFRFKTDGLPQNTASVVSQSLWLTDGGVNLRLRYTGSGYTSGSYSGSIISPYYQYALLEFIPDTSTPTVSASVYLPFYNEGWWSVLINSSSNGFELFAKNKNYEGNDGNTLSFQASSSITGNNVWATSTKSIFASSSYKIFSGSLQEIRYYTQALGENAFDAYVMNPYSIEEDENLAFRASLGGELYTSSVSIHPKITGSWVTTSSFVGTNNFFTSSGGNWAVNREVIYFDQFAVGIQNPVSDKITNQQILLPYTSNVLNNIPNNKVLSAFNTIQQSYPISQSYTNDVNYLEAAFSPQNEINEDINSSIGFFNIGELIGDPRQLSSSAVTYPDLDILRDAYFEKYISNYDWVDFINLIAYYDNSLFKMIVDFVPAKSGLASGIVIKQNILERNKYPQPQINTFTTTSYYGSGSQPDTSWNSPITTQNIISTSSILTTLITGNSGGSVPNLGENTQSLGPGFNIVPITQSWIGNNASLSGSIPYTESYQYEFFNGEFSGSNVIVENGKLNDCFVEIVEVYTTASIPLPGLFTPLFKFTGYDLDIENTYYLSFTITNSGSGLGGARILYFDENGKDKTIYYRDDLTSGSAITINQLEIGNLSGNQSTQSPNQTKPVQFTIPIYFNSADSIFGSSTLTNFTIYKAQLNDLSGDCEPLTNNVLANRPNPYYMDVDFSDNPYIAVNQQSILTGSATRFAIPQSDYTTLKHAGPRYFGSRTIAPDFGQAIYKNPAQLPIVSSAQVVGITDLYQNLRDGTLSTSSLFNTQSQVPNVENYSQWFCYFNQITSSNPEYPSGSNLNLFYIIDNQGRAYGLSNQGSSTQQINDYLYIISNIYPKNSLPDIIPISGSNVTNANALNDILVIEGGARYQSICTLTGSAGGYLYANWSGSGWQGETYFSTASVSLLTDTSSLGLNTGFLAIFLSQSATYDSESVTILNPLLGLNIWNKNTLSYVTNNTCSYSDTLFPLQYGDFIRFGNYSGSSNIGKAPLSSSLDFSFSGAGLTNFYSIYDLGYARNFTGGTSETSSINITPYLTGSLDYVSSQLLGAPNVARQNYRIFRRIPSQTNVLVGVEISGLTEGLLIPENYDPKLNPIDLAKIAGII